MKKALIYVLLLTATLPSCKKDHSQTSSKDKLYPVTFQLSNFTQDINSVKPRVNTVTPDQSNITELFYRVYGSSGNLLKTQAVLKGQPAFGTIRDSLASGNYTAVFYGITGTTTTFKDGETFSYTNVGVSTFFRETFYKKTTFTIASDYVQQSIVLDRLTSEMQVVLKDKIPAGIDNITATIKYDYTSFSAFSNIPSANISHPFTIKINPSDIGTANYTFTMGPLLNTQTPLSIELIANSASNAVIAKKTINNITLQRNTRTILTGNLFTNGTSPGGFNIKFEGYDSNGINQGF